jgi:polar amino acid transport system substrate-binding protein
LKLSKIRALATVAWGLATVANAAPIEIRGSFAQDIPPYIWVENGLVHGIELEIMQAALEPRGYKVVAKPLPINRMWRTFINGDLDFAAGLQLGEVQGNIFYSDEFLEYADVAIGKAGQDLHLTTPNDLFHYRVVAWQNAFIDLGLDKKNLPDAPHVPGGGFIEPPDSESGIRFFWAGRADVLVIDKFIYAWYLQKLRDAPEAKAGITLYDIFSPQIRVRIGFRDAKLCDDFNAGLKAIRDNGTYARIFEHYALKY